MSKFRVESMVMPKFQTILTIERSPMVDLMSQKFSSVMAGKNFLGFSGAQDSRSYQDASQRECQSYMLNCRTIEK